VVISGSTPDGVPADGIGRLVARLTELGIDDETWVVLTSDHGEEFLTHGWLGHTVSLYEELVRVPLIVRPPGGIRGRSTDAVVSTASLAPTLAAIGGADAPAGGFQVPSLAPLLAPGAPGASAAAGSAFAEVDFVPVQSGNEVKRTHKKAIVTDRFKLIRDDPTGRLELYDVIADRAERHDLAAREPGVVERLRPLLEEAVERAAERSRTAPEPPGDETLLDKLRSLGYAGG